jgi:hypothetical protein
MSNRLLSLLSEIEQAMKANDPSPDGGTWETLRIINFHQGLARLTLAVRSTAGATAPRGAVLLQSYLLADGSQCVKANLSWHGTETTAVYAIYAKPETNWHGEASQIAIKWLDGWIAATEAAAAELPQGQSASPLEKATG